MPELFSTVHHRSVELPASRLLTDYGFRPAKISWAATLVNMKVMKVKALVYFWMVTATQLPKTDLFASPWLRSRQLDP